jgi:hypothetical protein
MKIDIKKIVALIITGLLLCYTLDKVRFKLKFTKLIRSKNDNNKTKTNNMGNMSYCRFRNTLYDLQDCV